MTPSPPANAMVPVSLSAIAAALGYVQVGGFWKDQEFLVPHWQIQGAPRPVIWMTPPVPKGGF